MGNTFCSDTTTTQSSLSKSLQFVYGQDLKQGKIQHLSQLLVKQSPSVQIILSNCAQRLRQSKMLYKDPSIPTQNKLILKSLSKQTEMNAQIQAAFLRPYKFLLDVEKGKTYKIVSIQDSKADYILLNDEAMQYFAVFLCFLADRPHIIDDLILTKENTYGIHVVQMIINDVAVPIYIDDYILCSNQTPVFSQPIKSMYLWPCLLQKAWFKTHGFTSRIIQRLTPQSVFQSFLSYPFKTYPLQSHSPQSIYTLIKTHLYSLQAQYGCVLTTKKDPPIHIGVSGRKYLYLIGIIEVEGKRLYYVRNTIGRFKFRGQYDQLTQPIKQEIRKRFNTVGIAEGNFVLDESQFIEQISSFSICYYSKASTTTSFNLSLQNNNEIFIQTQLKTPGALSLSYRQQNRSNLQLQKYSPITYQMFNVSSGQLVSDQQNVEGCFGFKNTYLFANVGKKLPQGRYLIRIKKKDKKKHYPGIDSLLIATFTHQLRFDIKNQAQFSQQFKQLLKVQGKRLLTAKANLNQKSLRKTGIQPIDHCVYMCCDLICIYILYVSPKAQQYKIEISFPELKNLQLVSPEINLQKTSVLPKLIGQHNKQEIIIFQKIDLAAETELGMFQLEAF